MGRKIICDSCGAVMPFEKIKDAEVCPVCNVPFDVDSDHMESPDIDSGKEVEKKTFYYYDDGSATLDIVLYSHIKPLYSFQATDMEDAERQLKEVCPNSPLLKTTPSKQIRCPRCMSTQFQLVPRKFSLLTGFATNKFDRVCVMCKKRF